MIYLRSAIGPAAIKGLTRKERLDESKKGGITAITFICAGIFEEGSAPDVLPIFDIQVGFRLAAYLSLLADTRARVAICSANRRVSSFLTSHQRQGGAEMAGSDATHARRRLV
jgi:hypothetical protein